MKTSIIVEFIYHFQIKKMHKITYLIIATLVISGLSLWVSAQTPPYPGSDIYDQNVGTGLIRAGKVVRVPEWVYASSSFAEWKKIRGNVNPAIIKGLACNPYRHDGLALNATVVMPQGFSGHVPVYSFGNFWPFVGPLQPLPPHPGLGGDAGFYYKDGILQQTNEPLFNKGEDITVITNDMAYSIVLTTGSFPGKTTWSDHYPLKSR